MKSIALLIDKVVMCWLLVAHIGEEGEFCKRCGKKITTWGDY